MNIIGCKTSQHHFSIVEYVYGYLIGRENCFIYYVLELCSTWQYTKN